MGAKSLTRYVTFAAVARAIATCAFGGVGRPTNQDPATAAIDPLRGRRTKEGRAFYRRRTL